MMPPRLEAHGPLSYNWEKGKRPPVVLAGEPFKAIREQHKRETKGAGQTAGPRPPATMSAT